MYIYIYISVHKLSLTLNEKENTWHMGFTWFDNIYYMCDVNPAFIWLIAVFS